jgi:hypothetical protein
VFQQKLNGVLAAQLGAVLARAGGTGPALADGEPYEGLDTELVVEVLVGTGRHGTLTVVRMR